MLQEVERGNYCVELRRLIVHQYSRYAGYFARLWIFTECQMFWKVLGSPTIFLRLVNFNLNNNYI